MDNNDNIVMSRIAFERMQSKDERNDRWRNIIIILLIVLLVVTNAMWLLAWNQYEYIDGYSVEMNADDGSDANYIGGNGEINNGGKDQSNEDKGKDS